MLLPNIYTKTIRQLKTLVGNIEDVALINILNAKMANMITQTGVSFKQYNNSKPCTLSYYAMNFMNSGSNKDYTVDCINNYLIPFVEEYIFNEVEKYKNELLYQLEYETNKKNQKIIESEIDKIRCVNYELANPNYTGLYQEAKQIKRVKFGSLFIRIGELGDYLEEIVKGNQSKTELYHKLKDIYEGTISPNVIASEVNREVLKNIPVQVLMYTDFENLLDNKIKDYYLKTLKTGMARRSFIYMPIEKNKKLDLPLHPDFINQAINGLRELQPQYKLIFDKLINNNNKEYYFSGEAQNKLYEYRCQCINYYNESIDDIIIKLEVKESFWKITKLAVIFSILDNPLNCMVSEKYVDMAIGFYNKIQPSLKAVIEERQLSSIEKLAKYIYDNRNRIITTMMLRKSNILKHKSFSKDFQLILNDVKEELYAVYNCSLIDYDGDRNMRGYQVIEVDNNG